MYEVFKMQSGNLYLGRKNSADGVVDFVGNIKVDRWTGVEMRDVLNNELAAQGEPRVISSREGRQNIFDAQEDRDNEDAPRLDGGSWKPATETSDDEAEDVVGQPIDLPIPGEGPREL